MNYERLIGHVQAHKELYDTTHPKYGDIPRKEMIWEHIGEKMNLPGVRCKKSWTSLRDCFRKFIRKREISDCSAMKVRKWKYEDEMSFLIPYFQERKHIRLVCDNPFDADIIISDDENHDKKSEDRDIGESAELESSASYKFTPLNGDQEDSFTMLENNSSQNSFPEKDKDKVIDAFLASVGATIKTFSPYMQIMAKSKIFNVVSEMELQHIKQNEQGVKRKFEQSNLSATSTSRNDDEHRDIERLPKDTTIKEEII